MPHVRRLALLLCLALPRCSCQGNTVKLQDASNGDDSLPPEDGGFMDAIASDAPGLDASIDSGSDASDLPDFGFLMDALVVDGAPGCLAPPGPPGNGPACGPALCGNNTIDTCMTCTPGPCCQGGGPPCCTHPPCPGGGDVSDGSVTNDAGMCCTGQTETCDGVALGGVTCAALGYSGGQLACNSSCNFDTSSCTVCATDPKLASCGSAKVASEATTAIGLASGHGQIALTWVTAAQGGGSLHFALFDVNLHKIVETPCFGPGNAVRTAVVATAQGWLVAVEDLAREASTFVLVLDAAGTVVGSHAIGVGGFPELASGPNDQYLLLTILPNSALQASLLDATGASAWSQTVFQNTIEAQYGSAVFAENGFLVAARTNTGVQVIQLDPQGQLGSVHSPGGSDTEYPQLTWLPDTHQGGILFADFSATPTMFFAGLDPTGATLAPPIAITQSPPAYYNPCPLAPAGGAEMFSLLAGYSGQTAGANHLDVVRLTGIGGFTSSPIMVEKDPKLSTSYRLTTLAGDAYIAWITGGYPNPIGLAQITP
jgi:hypothetical protein